MSARKTISMAAGVLLVVMTAAAEWPRPVQTQGTVNTNEPVVFADNTGRYVKSGTNYVPAIVSAPASNTASGSRGQVAWSLTDGTNFFYFYDVNGAGTGTGRWVRVTGAGTWP